MTNDDFINLKADIDLSGWSSSINALISDAAKAESSLQSLSAQLNKLGGGVDIKLNVTDSDLKNAVDMVTKLDSASATVKITTSDDDLDTSAKIVSDLDSATANVKVTTTVDDGLEKAKRTVSDLDSEKADVKVGVSGDAEVKAALENIQGQLEQIKSLAVIDLVMNAPDALQGLFDTLTTAPILGPLVEMDTALASIEGRTGKMIPDAEYLIKDLYTNAWGDSRQAIADVIVEASNLGIAMDDLEEAVRVAFMVQDVSGGDTFEILRAMDSLVKNDLVPNFTAAGDLLVTAMQSGVDRGQDLLDSVNEYGSKLAEVGISGAGALALFNSGLEAGIDNSDRIADAMRELGIRLSEMGNNPEIAAAFEQLDALSDIDLAGLFDAYQAGEITGDEFFEGFFNAVADAREADPIAAKPLLATLVGTQAEDFGLNVISEMTTVWDDSLGKMEGRAATASAAVNNTLGVAFTSLVRTVETDLVDALDNAFDISGKIELAKQGLQDMIAAINAGEDVSTAIKIGLEPLGLSDEFAKIESIVGNIVVDFLTILANVGEFLGKDVSGVRGEVARLGAQQLVTDIQVANPDEIASVIATATGRGVTASQINTAVGTAVSDLLEQGNVAAAKAVLDELSTGFDTSALSEFTQEMLANAGSAQAVIDAYEKMSEAEKLTLEQYKGIDIEKEVGLLQLGAVDTDTLKEDLATAVSNMKTALDEAIEAEDWDVAGKIAGQLDLAGEAEDPFISGTFTEQVENAKALATEMDTVAGDIGDSITDAQTEVSAQTETITAAAAAGQTAVTTASTGMSDAAKGASADVSSANDEIEQSTADMVNLAVEMLPDAGSAFANFWAMAQAGAQEFIDIVTAAVGTMNELSDVAASAGAGGSGGGGASGVSHGGALNAYPTGGVAQGAFLADPYHELMFSDEKVAILNRQTSTSLLSGLKALLGSAIGGGRNTTINVTQTLNAQSMAQAMNASNALSDSIRGYATR